MIMETRTVEINLPADEWLKIDGLLAADPKMTQAEYFRRLHNFFEKHKDAWWKLGGLEHYE